MLISPGRPSGTLTPRRMLRQILLWTGLFTLAKALNGKRRETSRPTAAGQNGKALQQAASEPRRDKHERSAEAPDWLIDNIAECSKNARAIYLLYLGFLAYCTVTLFGVTDRQIVLDEGVRLPLVNVDVALRGFFFFAPIFASVVFVYLQLYLQRLKQLKLDLEDGYSDTNPKRLYPWMLNIADRPEPGSVGGLQRLVVGITLWWALPIVLSYFSFVFLKTHEPLETGVLSTFPFFGATGVAYFWYKYNEGIHQRAFTPPVRLFLIGVIATVCLHIARQHSMEGDGHWSQTVDLGYQVLIEDQNEEYDVYWLDLREAQLQGANLTSAVLKKADLEKANLRKAILTRANLQDARLDSAQLNSADLRGADLRRVDLPYAHLQGADLTSAVLRGANLRHANLKGSDTDLTGAQFQGSFFYKAQLDSAKLRYARLDSANLYEAFLNGADLFRASLRGKKTDLRYAELRGADLRGADLRYADLRQAKLQGAILRSIPRDYDFWNSPDIADDPKSPVPFKPRHAQLQHADLRDARLNGADLSGAQLDSADLRLAQLIGATITGASLRYTDLGSASFEGVIGYTTDQLCQARNIDQIEPDALRQQLRSACPEKFEVPEP